MHNERTTTARPIHELILEFLEAHRWSKGGLARAIGISAPTLSAILDGRGGLHSRDKVRRFFDQLPVFIAAGKGSPKIKRGAVLKLPTTWERPNAYQPGKFEPPPRHAATP